MYAVDNNLTTYCACGLKSTPKHQGLKWVLTSAIDLGLSAEKPVGMSAVGLYLEFAQRLPPQAFQ